PREAKATCEGSSQPLERRRDVDAWWRRRADVVEPPQGQGLAARRDGVEEHPGFLVVGNRDRMARDLEHRGRRQRPAEVARQTTDRRPPPPVVDQGRRAEMLLHDLVEEVDVAFVASEHAPPEALFEVSRVKMA